MVNRITQKLGLTKAKETGGSTLTVSMYRYCYVVTIGYKSKTGVDLVVVPTMSLLLALKKKSAVVCASTVSMPNASKRVYWCDHDS